MEMHCNLGGLVAMPKIQNVACQYKDLIIHIVCIVIEKSDAT